MKKISCLLFISIAIGFTAVAQNIGIGTQTPDSSALLELSSNSKGFLPPRMTTTERNAISNPAIGLMIYNTTTDCVEVFSKGRWQQMFCGTVDSSLLIDTTAVTDIDGNTYPTVKICNQTWMAKNLDVARYRNGDIIPQVTDPTQWANLTTGAWCWYNNDSATYGALYGRLYNWYAVNDPRGLAPQGWHMPSDEEWTILTDCLGGNEVAGGKMKSTGTQFWASPNTGASNSSGFSALPGGLRFNNGSFNNLSMNGIWWTSNFGGGNRNRGLNSDNSIVSGGENIINSLNFGFSVRCVKDVPPSTIDSGLVAFYPFNGNANDESGNGNNGVVNGATLTTDRFGKAGKAYCFDGVNDWIEVPANSKFDNLNEISISTWISIQSWCTPNVNGVEFFPILVQYAVPQMQYGKFGLQLTKANESSFYFNSQVFDYNQNNINYWPQTQWIHVCVSVSNGIGKWYVNGINVNTINGGNIGSALSGLPVLIGKQFPIEPSDYHTNGKIDDIRIYNRALTQEEISYLAGH